MRGFPMSDMNRSFAGQMPEFYDRYLVPMMFAPFAQEPFDLRRRRAREDCLITAREKLQFSK